MNNPKSTIKFYRNFSFIEWRQNDKRHRLDGPAIECANGDKFWLQNGLRHRLDGPAVELISGDKGWFQNGLRHRLDGPAIESADGTRYWHINGVWLTQQEHSERIKK